MTNTLFDLFANHKSARTIWNTPESRYGGDDADRKKYVVGKWLQFQIVDATAGVMGKDKHRDVEFFELIFPLNKELDNQIASLSNNFDSSSTSSMKNVVEVKRSKRQKTERSFRPDFLTSFLAEDLNKINEHFVSTSLVDEDPKTYVEAVTSIDSSFWKEATKNELDSIMTNHTWDLVDLLIGSKPIKCKWIFKKKIKPNGSIDKFKARLVVVGYTQKKGIDYFDTYSPVTKISTIRALVALSAINDLMIHQMDVKTAFLNGDLDNPKDSWFLG
ncbi:Retrovirus-related Pol polyprotein from transposon TNT 1-94 [Sesamum angolense]|uniref:Retrovirus-related Pol polyprotein from transposon TNT 1-94 n=1 Tax=Sesamum angolense TaxID=2727404 RepID=A0AAE1WB96_9LAMI|nr:Retrovirus-related Pol polyprotein from transposon TNT 1-94 [Sesamum angolense]